MLVAARDGRHLEVRRRWFPWKLRKRKLDIDFNPFGFIEGADDLAGVAFGLVAGIVLFLFGGLVLTFAVLAGEALLVLLLLVPLLAAARLVQVLPWIIEVEYGDEILGTVAVRGWRASEEKLQEVAAAYQRGEDPFAGLGQPAG